MTDPGAGQPPRKTEEHPRHHGSAVERIRARVEEKAARRAAAQQPARSRPCSRQGRRTAPAAARRPGPDRLPGVGAERPTQIPWRGWKQIVRRAWTENTADNMPIIAAGVAFFGFLALFPALIAIISIYGLVASPQTVTSQIEDITQALPASAAGLISDQLRSSPPTRAVPSPSAWSSPSSPPCGAPPAGSATS